MTPKRLEIAFAVRPRDPASVVVGTTTTAGAGDEQRFTVVLDNAFVLTEAPT